MRQARIGGFDGFGQRIDNFALDAVRQMAAVGDVLKTAPAVGDFLVLGQRVGDQREGADIGLEGFGKRHRRLLADLCRRILQQVQGDFQRQRFAIDAEGEARHRLVEQPVEGGSTRHRFFQEKLLQLVVELIGLVHAQVGQPGPVVRGKRIVFQRLVEDRVIDPIELQREEQQMRRHVGELRLYVAIKLAVLGLGRVREIGEAGKGSDAAHDIFERFELPDGGADAVVTTLRRGLGQLALPLGFEGGRFGLGLFQVVAKGIRCGRRIEIFEPPGGQVAEIRGSAMGLPGGGADSGLLGSEGAEGHRRISLVRDRKKASDMGSIAIAGNG
ncbi:hypothetical protein D9M72_346910 [compost metagenome]